MKQSLPTIVSVVLGALGMWLLLPRPSLRGRLAGAALAAAAAGLLASQLPGLAGVLDQTLFYILAGVTVSSAAAAVSLKNPVYCAIWFAMTVLGTAGLFLLQGAQFLAVATIRRVCRCNRRHVSLRAHAGRTGRRARLRPPELGGHALGRWRRVYDRRLDGRRRAACRRVRQLRARRCAPEAELAAGVLQDGHVAAWARMFGNLLDCRPRPAVCCCWRQRLAARRSSAASRSRTASDADQTRRKTNRELKKIEQRAFRPPRGADRWKTKLALLNNYLVASARALRHRRDRVVSQRNMIVIFLAAEMMLQEHLAGPGCLGPVPQRLRRPDVRGFHHHRGCLRGRDRPGRLMLFSGLREPRHRAPNTFGRRTSRPMSMKKSPSLR